MRVLIGSTRGGRTSERLAAFARALDQQRHDVTWAAPGPPIAAPIPSIPVHEGPRPERTAASLALRVGRDLLRHRPDVAILRLSPGIAATSALLAAARVPVILDLDDHPRAPDGLPPEGEHTALTLAVRSAAATIAASAASAARAHELGARVVTVIGEPYPLPAMLPGTRRDARAALQIPLDQPILAHVGPLEPSAHLELLHEAHRHAAGVGLLIVEHGPRATFAHAMTMSTRPSSPVLVLTPEAAPVALWAADALVWLGSARAPAALDPLALGRRLVMLEHDAHLAAAYPPALQAVHLAEQPNPRAILEAMGRALQAEHEQGPLPAADVARARAHLDQPERLLALLQATRR